MNSGGYDFGARLYDARLGKFLSIDPLSQYSPWNSPYLYAANKPITHLDFEGLEEKYYTLTFDDDGHAVLENTHNENHWYLPNLHNVYIPELNITITFTENQLSDFFGTPRVSNRYEEFENFKKDPVGALTEGNYISDQEVIGDAAKDVLTTLIMRRMGKTPGKSLPISKGKTPSWLLKVREGVEFQKSRLAKLTKDKVNFKTGTRLVPQNGKGNVVNNRTDADALIKNKDGSFTLVEYKLTKDTKLSPGQNASKKQIENHGGDFEVRTDIPEWNLKKGDKIKISKFTVETK